MKKCLIRQPRLASHEFSPLSLVSFMSLSLHFKEECRIFYCAGLCTAASLPFYEDISAPRVSCNTEPGRGQ